MKINTKQLRTRILNLYYQDKRVAEDDKYLISKIWQEDGWNNNVSVYVNLLNCTSPESIRRTRARLVQEGLIKVSDKTQEARYQDYKQAMMNI
jgi:hypothetical protein